MLKMFRPLWLLLLFIMIPVLACSNLLPEPSAAIPPPPTLTIPTPLAAPTTAFDLAPTATASGETESLDATAPAGITGPVITALVDVNVRTGPGVAYERDGFLLGGESAAVTGRDPESGWWQIACPPNAEGSSCWVTGGAAYTAAANTDDVPVAEAPPLPTPKPTATPAGTGSETEEADIASEEPGPATTPTPSAAAELGVVMPDSPYVVYVDNGNLFILFLNEKEGQIAAGTGRQLTTEGGITGVWVNPDGKRMAYVREEDAGNALHIYNLETATDQRITGTSELPPLPGLGTTQQSRWLDQVQWLADGQRLIFNTRVVAQEPGTGPAYDLWIVRPGAAPVELYPANTAGATFSLSPRDELLLTNATTISRAGLEGLHPETVLTFDLVNTGSEFLYFPTPQWSADGNQAQVAIPAADPFARDAETGLWRIPAGDGSADLTGRIEINPLSSPLFWNVDGNRLAYLQSPSGRVRGAQLYLADGDGSNAEVYERGSNLRFLAWGPEEDAFLYSGNGYFAVGRAGSAPVTSLIPARHEVEAGRWLNNSYFLITARTPDDEWQLISGNPGGDATPLITFTHPTPIIDHWFP